jgi:small subunit ribosomal protein S12e
MDVFQALQQVLKTSLIHDGLARGLREAVKSLDRRQAHLCVLAGDCDEPTYVALVRALCDEHDIKLIKVPEAKQLGEWVGLCKIDEEGSVCRVCVCARALCAFGRVRVPHVRWQNCRQCSQGRLVQLRCRQGFWRGD